MAPHIIGFDVEQEPLVGTLTSRFQITRITRRLPELVYHEAFMQASAPRPRSFWFNHTPRHASLYPTFSHLYSATTSIPFLATSPKPEYIVVTFYDDELHVRRVGRSFRASHLDPELTTDYETHLFLFLFLNEFPSNLGHLFAQSLPSNLLARLQMGVRYDCDCEL